MIFRTALLSITVLLMPDGAIAQTVSLSPSNPRRWDASVSVGWLGGDKHDLAPDEWNDWYDTFATWLEVGRYWTANLKTEAAATFTTDGEVYSHDLVAVPGLPGPVVATREHHFRITGLNLSTMYQLFENSWVHPYAGAGVQLAWERHRAAPPFPVFTRDGRGPFPAPLDDPSGTRFDPAPFVSAGAKFYVNEQGFIRSDVSTAFERGGVARVWWRIGGGIDF